MKFALIGSGSGGHIYPCIAFYRYATKCNHQCYPFIFKKIDEEIYSSHQIQTIHIDAKASLFKQYQTLKKHFQNLSIDGLITFGGKASFIAILAARSGHFPIYVCEQNVVFGKANFLGQFFAKKVFLSLPMHFKKEKEKYLYTGNPVVQAIHPTLQKRFIKKQPTLLLVCGSLGSSTIFNHFQAFIRKHTEYNFILVLGKKNPMSFEKNDHVVCFDYYEPLTDLLASCDIVISRAGASTMSEIIALNVPSILIPSPYVANNHQFKNAKFLCDQGGCLLLQESEINEESIQQKIQTYVNDLYFTYQVKQRLKALQVQNPCQKMLQVIEENTHGH